MSSLAGSVSSSSGSLTAQRPWWWGWRGQRGIGQSWDLKQKTFVYSTCTLSPVQNDWVVHKVLGQIWEETNLDF